ncbi:PREDICTED: ylmG homolog protein 1-2, chloroplastic-like [Ipomoea nil]|uniref:ylmG homolog protein 1-2, chloroplastic-like n=1 Tax=Ipomoea nil TaxID=35883 RepID=UPI0009014D40|nr:PREDICTED: ylmG homolog protein 1-2, chloroplastic-like [Ipomoea nil]
MASALMASQTLILQTPTYLQPLTSVAPTHNRILLPRTLSARSLPTLSAKFPNKSRVSASSQVALPTRSSDDLKLKIPAESLLTGPTRTIATLFVFALGVSKVVAHKVLDLGLHLNGFQGLQRALVCSAGPLFFAARSSLDSTALNTPLTVVAAGMAKWLDIYSGVLMVRVLLSWFPNIPWERQPLSAIRDLCDPYLNLFRNIIPPVFDTLDVSPLLAFAVLGALGSILSTTSTKGL